MISLMRTPSVVGMEVRGKSNRYRDSNVCSILLLGDHYTALSSRFLLHPVPLLFPVFTRASPSDCVACWATAFCPALFSLLAQQQWLHVFPNMHGTVVIPGLGI
jgi:hypothetical protein